jgi:hypothetical protein
MLSFLFGFNARLGRMYYFLSLLALAATVVAVLFALERYTFQLTRGAYFHPQV